MMTDLEKTVLKHCPGLSTNLLDAHFRRMPESYTELYSPAEIGRHLRLIAKLSEQRQVELDVKALGGPNYEVCVVGIDRKGALAAITTALASDGFDVQDLRLSTYLPWEHEGEDASEPTRFVDVARVSPRPCFSKLGFSASVAVSSAVPRKGRGSVSSTVRAGVS